MPTETPARPTDPISLGVTCPQLLTPPPELDERVRPGNELPEREESVEDGEGGYAVDDNTARGMAYAQEVSMYTSSDDCATSVHIQADKDKPIDQESEDEQEKETVHDGRAANGSLHNGSTLLDSQSQLSHNGSAATDKSTIINTTSLIELPSSRTHQRKMADDEEQAQERVQDASQSSASAENPSHLSTFSSPPYPSTLFWDFTHLRQTPRQPSSLLRPGSKFTGTQQSDRQIYNVDVDILTLDISQSSLTGYLRICGLTEDHPTLTTFFTGEIIGGPNQKYSFRTKNPSWGATDKTDLIHWARFPAWKSLTKDAKRNIDFDFPIPGSGSGEGEDSDAWWQQENVYMRWKEHFLVPDHRVRSIVGASFEGFYYATFNQVEKKISGIYFHAKSERYQQLELKHVFDKGVFPSVEFR